MTPLMFAQSLSRSDVLADRALGAAIVLRGLTDDDPDATRQGWPLNADTAERAIRWLGLTPDPELIAATLATAPTVSDAMLNRGPR